MHCKYDTQQFLIISVYVIAFLCLKEEIIVSTGNDKELEKLIKCVEEKSIDNKDADLRKYANVFNELTVVDGLVLRGERIVGLKH